MPTPAIKLHNQNKEYNKLYNKLKTKYVLRNAAVAAMEFWGKHSSQVAATLHF